MDKVALKGMKFFAYHGYYPEEQLVGANYLLDVEVSTNLKAAGESDQLVDTINYENIFNICQEVMAIKAKLLEHIVYSIEQKLCSNYPSIRGLNIRLQKLNPPLGASVFASQIEIVREYHIKCSRCDNGSICHNNEACWCKNYKLSPAIAEKLSKDYRACLCEACLSSFGTLK